MAQLRSVNVSLRCRVGASQPNRSARWTVPPSGSLPPTGSGSYWKETFAPVGEEAVSPGSEPGRDDNGLPPVDVEIPDDARELDRDVQAYRRELRAVRRQERRSRWHRSLGKDGIVLPLLACCLVLALIAGTLLTVFTVKSEQGLTGMPGSGPNSGLPGGSGRGVPQIVSSSPLPRADITVDGVGQVRLDELHQAMLVLVPPGCDCGSTLAWLADVAASAHATPAYVVYDQQTQAEVQQLYAGLSIQLRELVTLAYDTHNVLTSRDSFPAGIAATRLTAVLVAPNHTVKYASSLSPDDSDTGLVQAIIA
jgi:hypothetical protein